MSGRWPLDITVRQNQGCRDFLVSYFLIREQHSGIHIKRSFVLVGFFVCLLRVLTNQLYVHQSTCTLGSSASHLTTGSFSAGPTAWPLLLSEGPPLQGLQDTSFTFLWMWHPSRRAADHLLGLCHRSARKTSPFARQRLPMQGQMKYGESYKYSQSTRHMQRPSRIAGSRDKAEMTVTCTSEPPNVGLLNYQE